MMRDDISQLTQLGSAGQQPPRDQAPCAEMLESFPNQFPDKHYKISHVFHEFTSLCPKTGQPDFATITFNYIADKRCIESKSLKLYLFAWRNQGTFMETIVNTILHDLVTAIRPCFMQVIGEFAPRGGIRTIVDAEYNQEEDEEDLPEDGDDE